MCESRKDSVYVACHEEIVENMKPFRKSSPSRRNLLSVFAIGARSASWRIVSSIEREENSNGAQKTETERAKICEDTLNFLDKHLILCCIRRMMGDYHSSLSLIWSACRQRKLTYLSILTRLTLDVYLTLIELSPISKITLCDFPDALRILTVFVFEESYKDLTLSMPLLRDNLTLWT
ncbi:14-3-3 protein [Lentinula raphanica]|nr:14-3-3 protein [Lentinula raphanica]